MDQKALIKFLKTKGEERKQKLYDALQFQIADAEDTKKYFSSYNQTLAVKQTRIEQIKKTSIELEGRVKECRREREQLFDLLEQVNAFCLRPLCVLGGCDVAEDVVAQVPTLGSGHLRRRAATKSSACAGQFILYVK